MRLLLKLTKRLKEPTRSYSKNTQQPKRKPKPSMQKPTGKWLMNSHAILTKSQTPFAQQPVKRRFADRQTPEYLAHLKQCFGLVPHDLFSSTPEKNLAAHTSVVVPVSNFSLASCYSRSKGRFAAYPSAL